MGSIGPGPAYSLPTTIGYDKHDQRKIRSPQYSMAAKFKDPKVSIVPGPGLNTQGLTRVGRPTSYAYTMAPKTSINEPKRIGPGPASYDVTKKLYVNYQAPPAYSMGQRTLLRNKNICPGPNAYGVKSNVIKTTAPAYSMGVKTSLKTKGGSPGPANYPPGNLKVTYNKAPEYSMSVRTKSITNKLIVPGANAYDRTNYKPGKNAPAYSFGVRHSPRAPPMIVPCDQI